MTRSLLLRATFVGVVGVLSSCTFGNLADYEVRTCNPGHQGQAEDECDELNHGDTTGCSPFQCDKATLHCVRKTRDDDRDGNPPPACGGTDCDDHDALNGGSVELCDGHDNNCNGLIDDGIEYTGGTATPLLQSAPSLGSFPDAVIVSDSLGVVGSVVATAMMAQSCVDGFGLDSSSPNALLGASNAACSFLADEGTLTPRQPVSKRLAGGTAGAATAFVATSSCLGPGALGYRWFEPPQSVGSFTMPCPNGTGTPAKGVALPTLEDIGDSNTLGILFYDVPIADRDSTSTVTGCPSLASAPLDAMVVGYGTATPGPILHLTDGIATAPPGTLTVAGLGALIAAPVEATKSASVFLLTSAGTSTELAPLPDFTAARAVRLASGPADAAGKRPIAIVGELGCSPQTIVIAFGTLDPSATPPSLTVSPAKNVVVAAAGARAIQPAVAWQQDAPIASGTRSEWLVTWTNEVPGVMARRYDRTGEPLSNGFSVGQGIIDAVPGADGRVYVVQATPTSFQSVSLRCAPQ